MALLKWSADAVVLYCEGHTESQEDLGGRTVSVLSVLGKKREEEREEGRRGKEGRKKERNFQATIFISEDSIIGI